MQMWIINKSRVIDQKLYMKTEQMQLKNENAFTYI